MRDITIRARVSAEGDAFTRFRTASLEVVLPVGESVASKDGAVLATLIGDRATEALVGALERLAEPPAVNAEEAA